MRLGPLEQRTMCLPEFLLRMAVSSLMTKIKKYLIIFHGHDAPITAKYNYGLPLNDFVGEETVSSELPAFVCSKSTPHVLS